MLVSHANNVVLVWEGTSIIMYYFFQVLQFTVNTVSLDFQKFFTGEVLWGCIDVYVHLHPKGD